jgi:hypothetical protein
MSFYELCPLACLFRFIIDSRKLNRWASWQDSLEGHKTTCRVKHNEYCCRVNTRHLHAEWNTTNIAVELTQDIYMPSETQRTFAVELTQDIYVHAEWNTTNICCRVNTRHLHAEWNTTNIAVELTQDIYMPSETQRTFAVELTPSIHLSIHPMALTAHIGPRPPLARFRNLTLRDGW